VIRAGIRNQGSGFRDQKTEGREQRTEGKRQKLRKSEDEKLRRQRTEFSRELGARSIDFEYPMSNKEPQS